MDKKQFSMSKSTLTANKTNTVLDRLKSSYLQGGSSQHEAAPRKHEEVYKDIIVEEVEEWDEMETGR